MKARTKKPASVSATVQRLLAQIHAEAEARALEALSAKDGIVVLFNPQQGLKTIRLDGDRIFIKDGHGFEVDAYRNRVCPVEWARCPHLHHPAYWHVYESRIDGNGVSWSRPGRTCVTDDFGNLVDVEGGSA